MRESIQNRKNRALKIYDILEREYPEAACHLKYENPFQLLISTLLAAQCTDDRVNETMVPVYKTYRTPADFLTLKPEELETKLRALNFYRNKTKSVLACCRTLIDEHGGEVPRTMEELVKLAGVGRKTANVVLGNCFGLPAIMTDTHLMRVSKRLGLTSNEVPEKIEMDLKKIIPEDKQIKYSHIFGEHGRQVCHARKAKCDVCAVNSYCPSKGKV